MATGKLLAILRDTQADALVPQDEGPFTSGAETSLLSGAKFVLLPEAVKRARNGEPRRRAGGAVRGQIELERVTIGVTAFPSRDRC